MKVYQVTQKPHENKVVMNLNASILTATFKDKNGIQKADLYASKFGDSPKKIVAHNTCAPIHYKLLETILIDFN